MSTKKINGGIIGLGNIAEQFARDLSRRVNELMADPERCLAFGKAGRKRAEELFSWGAIAAQVEALYLRILEKKLT